MASFFLPGGKTAYRVLDGVYEPAEDSFLLAEAVDKHEPHKFLDMGCGTGIQGIIAGKKGAQVIAVDVEPLALKNTQENAARAALKQHTTLQSDLFEKVKGTFDVIAFNPPYLPSDTLKHADLDGGKKGRQIIDRFLQDVSGFLTPKGKALLVHSSLNDQEKTEDRAKAQGLSCKTAASKRVFFEELKVISLTKHPL